jgi:hypothetical protein
VNLYGFVENDGVNWWDLLGLASVVQTGQRERHHWFPLDGVAGKPKFDKICPGHSIDAWTTPYHQSDHGMFNKIGYTKVFWAAVDANPKITCCELLLFGRVMMTTMNMLMIYRGRGPIVSQDYPQSRIDILRMGLPPLYTMNDVPSNQSFSDAIDKECDCEDDTTRRNAEGRLGEWATQALGELLAAADAFFNQPSMVPDTPGRPVPIPRPTTVPELAHEREREIEERTNEHIMRNLPYRRLPTEEERSRIREIIRGPVVAPGRGRRTPTPLYPGGNPIRVR